MKLHFSWEGSAGTYSPSVSVDVVNNDGVSPLACLLTDDGGQALSDTVPLLDEGVRRIKYVKDSKINFADWSRDAWGAELTNEEVKIYSLYDENYFELINIDSLEIALLAWLNFIQMKSEVGVTQEVEI